MEPLIRTWIWNAEWNLVSGLLLIKLCRYFLQWCKYDIFQLLVTVGRFVLQIAMLKNSSKVALKELKHWISPEKVYLCEFLSWYCSAQFFFIYHMNLPLLQVKTSLATFPSSAEIVSEPLGVVLVISAWNYPFRMLIFWRPFFICFWADFSPFSLLQALQNL